MYRQLVFVLSCSSGHEGASMWSYSSISEDKLDLLLQNHICFQFPLLPSCLWHVATEEKEMLSWTHPVWRLGAWFIQALMSRSYSKPLVLFSDFVLWFTASVKISCNSVRQTVLAVCFTSLLKVITPTGCGNLWQASASTSKRGLEISETFADKVTGARFRTHSSR